MHACLTHIKAPPELAWFTGVVERAMSNESQIIELDARGFEPPQPLLKTLEAIATLPAGSILRVHTRWRPALLYAELDKRGFVGESQEQSDGSCITHIRRI